MVYPFGWVDSYASSYDWLDKVSSYPRVPVEIAQEDTAVIDELPILPIYRVGNLVF